MTLYLVRWQDLSCTLVTARDEDHLGYLLDEVGNPEGCRWTEYDGPVFIDSHLPVRITIDWPEQAGRPLSPEAVQIEDLDRLTQRGDLQVEVGAGDTAGEMRETIMEFAFPATAQMYCDTSEEVLEESQWRDALRAVELGSARNWELQAQGCEVSAPEYHQACASCNYPLHPEWRCCPVCEKPVRNCSSPNGR